MLPYIAGLLPVEKILSKKLRHHCLPVVSQTSKCSFKESIFPCKGTVFKQRSMANCISWRIWRRRIALRSCTSFVSPANDFYVSGYRGASIGVPRIPFALPQYMSKTRRRVSKGIPFRTRRSTLWNRRLLNRRHDSHEHRTDLLRTRTVVLPHKLLWCPEKQLAHGNPQRIESTIDCRLKPTPENRFGSKSQNRAAACVIVNLSTAIRKGSQLWKNGPRPFPLAKVSEKFPKSLTRFPKQHTLRKQR